MKNTYIAIIVLVVLAGAAVVFGVKKSAEAPIVKEPAICTMEAKQCPDGSYVGRSGPKCEFAACPEAKTPVSAVKEFVVSGKNFSFSPSTITVNKGDRVKIIFENSAGFHDFKIDEYGVATKQTNAPTTEVLEFTADKAGSFEYYCSVGSHKAMGMKVTLIVE